MSAHLLLDCVSKSFSDSQAPALDDVTLEVPAGSCTAVLGPSGSGKSTILRVMAGLDLVSSGQVLVDGTDVAGLAPERRGMGMVFQRPLLFPHLSVLDNVAFADRVSGVPRAEARRNAERYLDMVQLGGYGRRSVQELSGGQEQRVAIARALAAQPGVLLLDEPFSALDPALRSDMHELIEQIREALSPTIILVTHDRDEASAVADRIAVLHHGELLQHDTVDRVYNRPASLRVARLMGGLNEVPGHVRDGVHVSPLGRIVVDPSTPDGAGTLVVRQEAVIVAGAGAGAADGADGAGLADAGGAGSAVGAGEAGADGAGSAVGAGEAGADGAGSAAGASEAGAGGAGSAVGASDPGAGGAYRAAAAGRVEGWVSGIRRQGPRRMARVEFHGGVELCAEMPPGYPLAVGSRVAMSLAAGAASVVPSN